MLISRRTLLRGFGAAAVSLAAALPFSTAAADSIESELRALANWTPGAVVSEKALRRFGLPRAFAVEPISEKTMKRMAGRSYKADCTVPREALRYLRIAHFNAEGRIQLGELVVAKAAAVDFLAVFKELFEAHYRIERMVLIDDYDADDERSMRANNTSAFNFRMVAGTKVLSNHSLGAAVDLNPLYNPYVKRRRDGTLYVSPEAGRPYADRSKAFPYRLTADDTAVRIFKKHGFTWGGDWKNLKDWQHFEKKLPAQP